MSTFSSAAWPPTNATVLGSLGDALTVQSVASNRWMVILGGILAFTMAWGIGANDVANAFATSVGAGSLTLKWACIIASFCEFGGAVLLGSQVTDTVRKKIIDVDLFDPANAGASNGPELLMLGFLSALAASSVWLVVATYFGLPVSTTHSIIGSLVGVGLAFRGTDAVIWLSRGSGLKRLKGMVGVILSWVVSPVLSGIFGVIIFLIVRTTVLRTANPYKNGFLFLPFFYAFTVAITIFFIIYKGSPNLDLDEKFSAAEASGIAIGGGLLVALISWWTVIPAAKRFVDRWEERQVEMMKNPEMKAKESKVNAALAKVGINVDSQGMHDDLSDDVVAMHDNAEKFDPKAEQLFSWLQVFTAAFDSFAHGANDVANSIGPFSSIFQLHKSNGQIAKVGISKFEESGTYTEGPLSGQSYAEDDPVPDGSSFCGTNADGVKFYQCTSTPRFPEPRSFNESVAGTAQEFSLYNDEGALTGETATCYTDCTQGNFASYGSNKQDVPVWILALGGAGIVLGLAMWGYRIIVAIGMKLTKLTPSRGFAIEVGAALTVIIASRIGLPVSTTHCQVGSTIGVGVVELKGNTVNWKQFVGIAVGWVFTVIFTGALAAAIFSFASYSPQIFEQPQELDYCPGEQLFVLDDTTNPAAPVFRGVRCSGIPTL